MRLAIIVPRYGEGILGGAETFARELAEHLPRSTFDVEVLTTCADDLHTWRNVHPPGLERVNDVPVRRFPIDHRFRDEERYWELMVKFTNRWPTTVDEEYEWIDNNAHSPGLYTYLDEHGLEYDLLIFIPYVFGTTFYGATLHPDRSVIWPCLHDEPFARFFHTRLTMSSCRGLMFNSEPEMALAQGKLAIRHPGMCVVGAGIEDYEADPDRFRRKFDVDDPFVLYAGRLSSMKNLLELFSFFVRYKRERQERSLKLVLLGKGPLTPPSHPDIIPLGFLPEQDKLDAYAAATLLCQPSLMESFSIVIMEAWLSGVPVLVHGDCDVTRYHVLRSNGGLYYAGFEEFAASMDWLMAHPDERAEMGALGRAYVLSEYDWSTVLERFEGALALWQRL